MNRIFTVHGRYGYYVVEEHDTADPHVMLTGAIEIKVGTRKLADQIAAALTEAYGRGMGTQ